MLIADSTAKDIRDTPRRMGRRLEFPEKREAAFAAGTLARIQKLLDRASGETQVGFIRDAVEREIRRREAGK